MISTSNLVDKSWLIGQLIILSSGLFSFHFPLKMFKRAFSHCSTYLSDEVLQGGISDGDPIMGARPPSQFIQNDQRTLGRPGNDLWGFAQLLHERAASLEDVVRGSHPDEANIYTREFMNGGEPTVIHHYSPCESSCVGTPNTLDTAESLMIMSLIVCDFRVRGWLIQGIQIDFPSFLSLWFLCWQTNFKTFTLMYTWVHICMAIWFSRLSFCSCLFF